MRAAPIQDIGLPVLPRTGAGAATSSHSSPRARARSIAPKPRHMASVPARIGTPRKVISMPIPSVVRVIERLNRTRAIGRPSSR
ncbi:hypothetical protein EES42_05885 [Streptomyces sp. ADI95-17]|nr:hypothetical protein EES42_05885 [Streptomyces sp. ADI95-17]